MNANRLNQTNLAIGFNPGGEYVASSTLGLPEHDQFFAQPAVAIFPATVSTYSELMPYVVAHE